jgi:hypothetical protein
MTYSEAHDFIRAILRGVAADQAPAQGERLA